MGNADFSTTTDHVTVVEGYAGAVSVRSRVAGVERKLSVRTDDASGILGLPEFLTWRMSYSIGSGTLRR